MLVSRHWELRFSTPAEVFGLFYHNSPHLPVRGTGLRGKDFYCARSPSRQSRGVFWEGRGIKRSRTRDHVFASFVPPWGSLSPDLHDDYAQTTGSRTSDTSDKSSDIL